MTSLRLDAVSFTYPDGDRPALHDASVSIAEGTFALVVGATGAGKSTFLRTVNGLVPHFTGGRFSGRVSVDGRDTLEHAPRALADAVAYVPQDAAASFVLDRVEDELAYGMENLGVDPAHMRRRVEEMLDLLDIEPLRRRSVRSLSGGEQQRVAIAAALAAGPRILALDEPTSQLDPQGAEHVVAALQRLVHDQGMTVLLAEHRLERVAGFVDLALGFDRGSVATGGPAEVIRRLAMGPPVARLGRLVGWDPVPLTVREARRLGGSLEPIRLPSSRPERGETLVRTRGLRATHGQAPALREIDLELARGEIVAVMGRNGAGKTTLLRSIAGVHEPSGGSVRTPDHAPEPGVDASLCPQEPEVVLFAETVADEVRATRRARSLPDDPGPILEAMGIAGLANHHPRDLSSGQRLLVATAAIAAAEAPVLLLDEPTRGLDPASKERLTRFLRSHAGSGGAAMVATHDVELAAAAATRVVILAGGEIVADGDPGTVLGDSTVFAPQMTRAFGAGWLTPEQVAEAIA